MRLSRCGATRRRISPGAGSTTSRKPKPSTARSSSSDATSCATPPAALARRQQQQPEQHAALEAQRIGQRAEGHAGRHAGHLHGRQQEPGLQQRQPQRRLQGRDRRRQLAHVQRRADAGQHHDHRRPQRAPAEAVIQRGHASDAADPDPADRRGSGFLPVRQRRPLGGQRRRRFGGGSLQCLEAQPVRLGALLAQALLLVGLVLLVVAVDRRPTASRPRQARMWVQMRSRNQRSWLMTMMLPANSSSASSSARSVSTSRSLLTARRAAARCRPGPASWPGAAGRVHRRTGCPTSFCWSLPLKLKRPR